MASASTTPAKKKEITINHLEIQRRAYKLWVQRGRRHGYDKTDWQEAEQQLKEERLGPKVVRNIIRTWAYFSWLNDGCRPGWDLEHWTTAERAFWSQYKFVVLA